MTVNLNQINPADQIKESQQSENSVISQELRKIADLRELQKQVDNKAYEKLIYDAKHLEALRNEKVYQKAKKDPGVRILADLADDLAKLGIANISSRTITKPMASRIDEELEKALNRTSGREDKYELRNHLTKDAVKRSQGQDEKEGKKEEKKDAKQLLSSPDVKEAVQNYSGAYAHFALAASPEAREKLEDAQEKLRRKGFSDREIASLERAVKRSFRTSFVSEIQDNFIQHMFSPKNSLQFIVTSKKLNNSYREAVNAEQLSGVSKEPEAIKEEMSRIAETSHEEIRDFIKDAVESKLMERHVSGMDNRAEVKKLVELGLKVGFNFSEFLKTWENKKFDLGLFVIEVNNAQQAENKGQIAIGEVSAGGVSDKHGYEMTRDEERELLINQLRAEFMKKALTGDPLAMFTFAPKIRKLKNGLIKLGLIVEDFQNIEKEAKVLARYRTLEMLRNAFIERSTYYELSGPAFGLLNNKIKGLIANLENLDMRLSREELDMLRDDANRQMHDHTIIELKSAMAILENHDNPSIEQKVPLMVMLIERLRAESGFTHGLGEDIEYVLLGHADRASAIKEHA